MADAGVLRKINAGLVREQLRGGAQRSKTELARLTGLSFPTVSKTVDQMTAAGELREAGSEGSTGGRAARLYEIEPGFALSLLLRLEGERLDWRVLDLTGRAIEGGGLVCASDYLQQISAQIVRVKGRYPQLDSVVFGIAATVFEGVIADTVLYHELRGVTLADELADRCGLPVAVENDMKAAALGCWTRRKPRKGALCCIYIGDNGAGSYTVLDGGVLRGAFGVAGDLGYLPLFDRPPTGADFAEMDMVRYYSDVIRCQTALLDPERIVLYENAYNRGRLEEICAACRAHLPAHVRTVIELSDEFETDYETGLAAIAARAREERENEI